MRSLRVTYTPTQHLSPMPSGPTSLPSKRPQVNLGRARRRALLRAWFQLVEQRLTAGFRFQDRACLALELVRSLPRQSHHCPPRADASKKLSAGNQPLTKCLSHRARPFHRSHVATVFYDSQLRLGEHGRHSLVVRKRRECVLFTANGQHRAHETLARRLAIRLVQRVLQDEKRPGRGARSWPESFR